MESILLKVPAIALRQGFTHGQPVKWGTAEAHGPDVIGRLLAAGWPEDVLLNINFPDVPAEGVTGVRVARQGRRDLSDLVIDPRVDARGVPYYWIGFRRQVGRPAEETDLAAVQAGAISVTPLQLDLTHDATLSRLKDALA